MTAEPSQDDRDRNQDISEMVREVYACISGPAGAPRDWARFRELHHPLARSLRTVVEDDGRTHAAIFDVEGYIADVARVLRAWISTRSKSNSVSNASARSPTCGAVTRRMRRPIRR